MKSAYYVSINGGRTGSRSRRAQIAEGEGKLPATRAAKIWGFRSAASLRVCVQPCEWHHVGKYANAVEYFDVEAWIDDLWEDWQEVKAVLPHLNKLGRQLILPRLVKSVVASNLDDFVKRQSQQCKRSMRPGHLCAYERFHQLKSKFGIAPKASWSTIGELTEENFLATIAREAKS